MRVTYFWYTPWPEAAAALPPDAEHAYTGPGTDGFWREFSARWTGEQDLVSIEQDVLIHDQVIPQFAACPEPWCSFAWQVGPGQLSYWWLGCTKYSVQLQRAIPLAELCCPNPPGICLEPQPCTTVPCHRHMDTIFPPITAHLGIEQPHYHTPLIRHLRAET